MADDAIPIQQTAAQVVGPVVSIKASLVRDWMNRNVEVQQVLLAGEDGAPIPTPLSEQTGQLILGELVKLNSMISQSTGVFPASPV